MLFPTLHLALHDLTDLPVNLSVVSVVAPHGDTPHQQPEATRWNAEQQVHDVICILLLVSQVIELVVHDPSLWLGWRYG